MLSITQLCCINSINSFVIPPIVLPPLSPLLQALAVISLLTLVILAFASELKQAATIQKVMRGFAGVWGGVITDLVVFLYSLATCIVFLVIIGDQVEDCEWRTLSYLPCIH